MVTQIRAAMRLTAPAGMKGWSLRVLWKTLNCLKAKGHASENLRLVITLALSPTHLQTDMALKLTVLPGNIKVRLCILQVKVMNFQDELESGKRQRNSSMTLQQQVQHYRNRLLQKVLYTATQQRITQYADCGWLVSMHSSCAKWYKTTGHHQDMLLAGKYSKLTCISAKVYVCYLCLLSHKHRILVENVSLLVNGKLPYLCLLFFFWSLFP